MCTRFCTFFHVSQNFTSQKLIYKQFADHCINFFFPVKCSVVGLAIFLDALERYVIPQLAVVQLKFTKSLSNAF